jgi:hypothetical protein
MNSPFTHLNTARLQAERKTRNRIIGAWIAALTVASGTILIAHMTLSLALALPDIIARAAALQAL